jgi:hypothetical protein
MVGIVLRLRSGVKDVARNDLSGDELSQIAQQWLIGRGDHDVATVARGSLRLVVEALST